MNKKKIYVFLLVLIAIVALAWATLVFYFSSPLGGSLSHNFGVVPIERPFTVLEHTFRLKNKMNHELRLKSATPTCGCTTTEWPEEIVLPGEEFVIPVHLKLRRSQLRKSQIRLEFDSGELAVLHVEGVGRFIQPMSISPPSLPLKRGPLGGAKGVIRLEWDGAQRPEKPVISFPNGVVGEFDNWQFSSSADPHKGIPEIWTIRVRLTLEDEALTTNQTVIITMPGLPQLEVPVILEDTALSGRISLD
ncbi:MAG: DUF1573 domain-containing protein [Phycisphaerales bacterium]|nr:DUF1573 domain-containing protein [Phycisphaerales bacterium]